MKLPIPEMALVVLIGASGSGKSSFARRHFLPTQIVSSDVCRGIVADDENDQAATGEAFDLLNTIIAKRLKNGRLTVVDATSVRPEDRRQLIDIARQHHAFAVAIVFDLPERLCRERNQNRAERNFGPHVIRNQVGTLHRHLRGIGREGFRFVHVLRTPEEVDAVEIEMQLLWNNRRTESGPFDIIGDVHGCFDELSALLDELGYCWTMPDAEDQHCQISHPEGRRLVFLGDLVDRGPRTPEVLRLVMDAVAAGQAYCIAGNHDKKLLKALRGRAVQTSHGLAESLEQLATTSATFRKSLDRFLDGLISHYVFDGGNLVVAHAGLKEEMHGRGSSAVREFALYGETTGEIDEYGLPVRLNWAADYRGRATVVYGHTPVPDAEWLNNTICLDTGCVFGGKLTALRYPERELVSVPARQTWYEPIRPLLQESAPLSLQQREDELLDVADYTQKRILDTRFGSTVIIRPGHGAAALEVLTRFAAHPKWLTYLPPTMSPAETSQEEGYLEHPLEALDYYRQAGIGEVVCQEKHMGSRAVVVVARDEATARQVFGISGEGRGIVYTRTGRHFFSDPALEHGLLNRLWQAIERAGWPREFDSDWFILDCELMPWSMKAKELLIRQYAAVGVASAGMLGSAAGQIAQAAARGLDMSAVQQAFTEHGENAHRFQRAYEQYCWPVQGLDGVRLAPFHLLASEGAVHTDKNHLWHMDTLSQLASTGEPCLMATPWRRVDLADSSACRSALDWWLQLTANGGEGMVIKPLDFIPLKERVQPAVKCRGREYLRIIYGPDYTAPQNLARLRQRGLAGKRALALKEFQLGLEGLHRFIAREPLRRVHECVWGVLALESEPLDPRL